MLEPFFTSTAVVAIGEIGDKTQLLAIVLAAKFRKPVPIILGILCATVLNHLLAASIGYYVSAWLSGQVFRVVVGVSFIAMAGWALIPDKMDDELKAVGRGGIFLTTLITFFLVEIGDKTQIATSLLAARYHQILLVALGTTLGMMIADVPAVLLGEAATKIVPLKFVRIAAASIFALIGVWVLLAAFHLV
ncbi:TMEM165/GDT1 family protein [Phenylobacterium sp.]|uniref:TMEM165/GDT1 family protein n=1 Tax=Phenylobacterium sp. TaxID=1871053 RepID=UPI002F41C103